MEFVVTGTDAQWEELKAGAPDQSWVRAKDKNDMENYPAADAYFILYDDSVFKDTSITKPVFINNLNSTLSALDAPANVFRINGWNGFLKRTTWEIAGDTNTNLEPIAAALHKKMLPVADEPGLLSARIVAMIINEAYFTVGDEISSRNETDTAMKLGTNYPYGPFEWTAMIGIRPLYTLLDTLQQADKRYTPAPLLVQEANSIK